MGNDSTNTLIEAFNTTPDNTIFAELVLKELVQNGAVRELKDFLLSSQLDQHIPQSFQIAQARANVLMEEEKYSDAANTFMHCLEFEDIPEDLMYELHGKLIRSLLAAELMEEAAKYTELLKDKFPEHDHSELLQAIEQQEEQHLKKVKKRPVVGELSEFSPLSKEQLSTTFKDVGGMEELKKLAQLKIIQPFKNPKLYEKYGKKAGGGILLYGPPGCGKTFFAKAIAGECDATFFSVGIHEILDMYMGNSERNIHNLFEEVRGHAPAILFIDEIDALGRKRELMRQSYMTTTINTFLNEMDGLGGENVNILVLGATNVPWDVDTAMKRPGRFDLLFFVPPPELSTRKEILTSMLVDKPIGEIDISLLAEKTHNFSGADLAALVDRTTELVIEEVLMKGEERNIEMPDFKRALKEIKGSISEWLQTAENYIEFANIDGQYDDMANLLQKIKSKKKTKKSSFGFF